MWQTIRTSALDRHCHEEAYVALVISGAYEEAGDHGRFQVAAGHAVFHEAFEAHLNRFSQAGAVVLNLGLSVGRSHPSAIAKVADVDSVVRTAENDRRDAIDLLLSMATSWEPQSADWPDELAAALMQNPSLRLSEWGEERGLAPWNISRGFPQIFGISPKAFRARSRARHAWKSIQNTSEPLAKIAAHLGFADQAHMTRSVKQLTGTGPGMWRAAANRFNTR